MDLSFHVASQLDTALRQAAESLGLASRGFDPEVRVADPAHGDYQANGALAFAKREKQNPRALAQQVVDALPASIKDLADISLAGPGFINFRLKPAALLAWLRQYDSEAHLRAGASGRGTALQSREPAPPSPASGTALPSRESDSSRPSPAAARHSHAGETWVVDYSSPNTAKQMHVGHLRSAVIGEAICRLLEFTGAKVIRDNHLGDWGTQFGKLIYGYKRWADPAALAADPIEELERIYKLGHAATPDGSPELEEAKRELVKLQQGDPENFALWKKFSDVSLQAFQQIYDRLGIRFDHNLGESFYNDKVERVYREVAEAGISEVSEGAQVVFHPEHPRFAKQPFLMRKADGASNYASTDLATALHRVEHFHADGIVIVTDFRQADHFEQLFLTVRKWFAAKGHRVPELHHVTFGAVTGEDGKALKTRDGGVIKLKALLDEAEERAFAIVSEKNPDLPEAERREIARAVGIGAVQYADLSQNRSSNYVFSWDKMLALDGNTAPYLLYAVARVRSIFRKAGVEYGPASGTALQSREPDSPSSARGTALQSREPSADNPGAAPQSGTALQSRDPSADEPGAAPQVSSFKSQVSLATPPESPQELSLARKLVQFADAVQLATSQLRPHFLCLYLFELAGAFSTFYAADKVIADDPAVRARRLTLCHRTLVTLETGLHLLGLRTLERM